MKKTGPYHNSKRNFIFKSSNRLGNYFKFKDRFPRSLLSGVVYKYTCNRCNSVYIGKTKRYYEKHLEEHLHVSALTGKPVKMSQTWPPMDHSRVCGGEDYSRERFSIVGHQKVDFLLKIKESLMIYELNPNLNKQAESTPLYSFT